MDSFVKPPVLAAKTPNFLLPNGTFIVELIAFAVIVFVLARYVIPPINKAMAARQDAIRKQFAELDEAKSDAHAAEEKYKEQLNEARHEAAKIREGARDEGAQIIADARAKAEVEAKRIIEHAHTQIAADRLQAVTTLRAEVGTMATTLASRIVGESLEDQARQTRVVERFLEELESTAGSDA